MFSRSAGSTPAAQPAPLFGSGTSGTFGSNQQSGGLFGNNNNTASSSQPTSGGLFGNNANTSASAGSGGLFGQKAGSTSTQPASGGLFGNNNTSTAQPASGGLFGAKPAAPSGGLFGSSNNTTNSTTNASSGGLFGAKPAQPSGGLFGGSSTTQAPASGGLFGAKPAQPSGGLFGGNQANTTQQNTSGGLFGSKPATTTTSGGLFGGNTQSSGLFGAKPAQPASGGLFGGSSAQPAQSGGLFGSNNTQAQPQQQQPVASLHAMTRVGDLPPNLKQELEQLNKYVETQHAIAVALQHDYSKHNQLIASIPKDVVYLQNKFSATKQALKFDTAQLGQLKQQNTEFTEDITKIMHLITQLSTPGTRLSSSFQLNEFFIKKIKKYRDVLADYERVVSELAEVLAGLERGCVDGFGNVLSVVGVIKAQYQMFMELCETMAQLHAQVQRLTN
ncbi:nucleoporin Nup49p/NSP49 [Diutina catenulata]